MMVANSWLFTAPATTMADGKLPSAIELDSSRASTGFICPFALKVNKISGRLCMWRRHAQCLMPCRWGSWKIYSMRNPAAESKKNHMHLLFSTWKSSFNECSTKRINTIWLLAIYCLTYDTEESSKRTVLPLCSLFMCATNVCTKSRHYIASCPVRLVQNMFAFGAWFMQFEWSKNISKCMANPWEAVAFLWLGTVGCMPQ